jgi:hypothetical protein
MCAGGSTPAGETQLPKLKVDGIGLVTARCLAVWERKKWLQAPSGKGILPPLAATVGPVLTWCSG